jgi:hypothetical protein
MLQLVIEVLAYEMIALLCGLLPESEARIAIGASVISLQVALFIYMFSLGASVAASIRSKSSVSDCFLTCISLSSHRLFSWKCIGSSRRIKPSWPHTWLELSACYEPARICCSFSPSAI